jgi:hypothetical protein
MTMRRRNFLWGLFASLPLVSFSRERAVPGSRTAKPFKVGAGEARFGVHYKMKGVTLNTPYQAQRIHMH